MQDREERLFQEALDWKLPKASEKTLREIQKNWDETAIPLDSLGQFQKLLTKIGVILDCPRPKVQKSAVLVFCSDNGVVEEGISQCGQEVTKAVALNMGKGMSSVNRMADCCGSKVMVFDVGMNCEENIPGVVCKKIAKGTNNFRKMPAMTKAQALQGILEGMELVKKCKEDGYRILATGEMGIGNTTTSSAITAALLGVSADRVTGKGAGLSAEGVERKIAIIEEAISKYDLYHKDPLEVLCCVGGFDLAAMTGVYLGGARYRMPIVLDGVISQAAALVAERLKPGCVEYMIPSHGSREPASGVILNELGLLPVLQADMALGEGTGAVMMLSLLQMAEAVYREEFTFEAISVKQYERFSEENEE